MSTVTKQELITVEEYLEGERTRDIKHEFTDGCVYAMAGASKNHERISSNISGEFRAHLKNSSCESFSSDMKVKTSLGSFRYPDCMVVCDDESDNDYYTESPVILVEIISKSTRKMDEKHKFLEYINIPTLQEYVIIEQDFVDVSVFRKRDGWMPAHYFLGESVNFASIDLTLSVEEIYLRVINEDMIEFMEKKNNTGQ